MPVSREYKPDYQLIIDYIEEHIAAGNWPPGHKLPTPEELKGVIDPPTSAATVRRATDTLQDRGVLVGRQGKGVYVAQHPPSVASTD